jgi:hypothetical protein
LASGETRSGRSFFSIEYILAYLNQTLVFDWLKCKGIVEGNIVEFSEKPIASIPFRKIDWDNPKEVAFHQAITKHAQAFIIHKNQNALSEINALFDQILKYACKLPCTPCKHQRNISPETTLRNIVGTCRRSAF